DRVIRVWDVATGKALRRLEGHDHGIVSLGFAPDGNTLASGSLDWTVRIWDVARGKELQKLKAHTDAVSFVAFAPDGKTVASSGTRDRTIILWDVGTGNQLYRFEEAGYVHALAFSASGSAVASVTEAGTVLLRSVKTGKLLRKFTVKTSGVVS